LVGIFRAQANANPIPTQAKKTASKPVKTVKTSSSSKASIKPQVGKSKQETDLDNVDLLATLSAQSVAGQIPSRNPNEIRKKKKKERVDTAGKSWYDMPATELTPEIK